MGPLLARKRRTRILSSAPWSRKPAKSLPEQGGLREVHAVGSEEGERHPQEHRREQPEGEAPEPAAGKPALQARVSEGARDSHGRREGRELERRRKDPGSPKRPEMSSQAAGQQEEIRPRGEGGGRGEGEKRVPSQAREEREEREVGRDLEGHGGGRGHDGTTGVAEGVEGRYLDLDDGVGVEPQGVAEHGGRRLPGVRGREKTSFEEDADDGLTQRDEPSARGGGQKRRGGGGGRPV